MTFEATPTQAPAMKLDAKKIQDLLPQIIEGLAPKYEITVEIDVLASALPRPITDVSLHDHLQRIVEQVRDAHPEILPPFSLVPYPGGGLVHRLSDRDGFQFRFIGHRSSTRVMTDLIRSVYSRHAAGCCLHIVLDDGNVDDHCMKYCADYAQTENHPDCIALAAALMPLSLTARRKWIQIAKYGRSK